MPFYYQDPPDGFTKRIKMTDVHAKKCRTEKLNQLGIQYPLWVFDVDQPAWPRKKADIPPNSRPAMLTGWLPWSWEYGTNLICISDPPPAGVTRLKPIEPLGSAQQVLDQLRYDDHFEADTFDIVYEAGRDAQANASKSFQCWEFEPEARDFVASRRILRIERHWDGAIFWDRDTGTNLFNQGTAKTNTAYGMATYVSNDGELLRATGVRADNVGEKIKKAGISLWDGDGEHVRGIVYPERWQRGRGLYLNRGPEFGWNVDLLRGTALQGAPWSEVEDYVMEKRYSPLM